MRLRLPDSPPTFCRVLGENVMNGEEEEVKRERERNI
jgi:hypothetical protein